MHTRKLTDRPIDSIWFVLGRAAVKINSEARLVNGKHVYDIEYLKSTITRNVGDKLTLSANVLYPHRRSQMH